MAKHKPSRPVFKGDLTAGSTFFFGRYPQKTDLAEPIEWRVLSAEEGMITAISVYGLDIQPYHVHYEPVSWDTCSLRSWLNSTFLNTAFTSKEQKKLVEKVPWRLENSLLSKQNHIFGLSDKVSILSFQEAKSYYKSRSKHESCKARLAYVTPFALKRGEDVPSEGHFSWRHLRDGGCCWWWLKTPGNSTQTRIVTPIGDFSFTDGNDVNDDTVAVRPVIVLSIKDLIQRGYIQGNGH